MARRNPLAFVFLSSWYFNLLTSLSASIPHLLALCLFVFLCHQSWLLWVFPASQNLDVWDTPIRKSQCSCLSFLVEVHRSGLALLTGRKVCSARVGTAQGAAVGAWSAVG